MAKIETAKGLSVFTSGKRAIMTDIRLSRSCVGAEGEERGMVYGDVWTATLLDARRRSKNE